MFSLEEREMFFVERERRDDSPTGSVEAKETEALSLVDAQREVIDGATSLSRVSLEHIE